MKISWILWWIFTILMAIALIGMIGASLHYGLAEASGAELFKFLCAMFGLFLAPIFISLVWGITNLIVSKTK
ncbi:hypothetical protein MHK01_01820 [Staphylococcus auricularis]|uniref:hypothetical protein n=1 Tax=Staphylococcus auricularis TaxID=29379 RepID=UPI001EF18C0B|nr:hypothetical protein [Staphylococcus auricularis]MCG7340771.1 hypothetical protein [Staphylococcus auricularis]